MKQGIRKTNKPYSKKSNDKEYRMSNDIVIPNLHSTNPNARQSNSKLKHLNRNVGESNYSELNIQPWEIWRRANLNAFDADIIKRVLRTKKSDSRIMDYKKIIHVCEERIAQLRGDYDD